MNTSRAPMNHAERPLFVTKVAVTVAIITIVTAPGQKLQVHWFGPDGVAQEHKHRCNEQGDSAMLTLISRRFLRAAENATAISAAAPTRATMMNPTKAGLIPSIAAACCNDSTKISLTNATSTVTTRSVPTARLIGHFATAVSPWSFARKEFLVSLQRERQAQPVC